MSNDNMEIKSTNQKWKSMTLAGGIEIDKGARTRHSRNDRKNEPSRILHTPPPKCKTYNFYMR